MPAWLDEARWYYSEIGGEESADPVSVFDASGLDEVNSESPGTLCFAPGGSVSKAIRN